MPLCQSARKRQYRLRFCSIFAAIVCGVTVGCTETVTKIVEVTRERVDTVVVSRPGGWSDVVIRVDWSRLEALLVPTMDGIADNRLEENNASLDVTDVGSRLVYIRENAAFTQSVKRDSGSTSLLTLRVPATDSADLFVVAVHNRNGVRRALRMGVRRALRISDSTGLNLTLDSLTFVDASWAVADSTVSIVNDTIVAVADTGLRFVRIEVRDPYQVGESPNFSNRILKFWGSGHLGANPSGWREFRILFSSATVTTKFWPYVDGSLFNLNNDFPIGSEGVIRVTSP